MPYRDNIDDVARDYDAVIEDTRGLPSLTVGNVMEYAWHVHETDGYYVLNDQRLQMEVNRALTELGDAGKPFTVPNIVNALDAAGFRYVNWLLALAGGTQPPVRAGEGRRQARRGSWADVTGNLAAGYFHKVTGRPTRQPNVPVTESKPNETLPLP